MKTIVTLLLVLVVVSMLKAQTGTLPKTELKTPDETPVSSTVMLTSGNPTILVFWKSTSGKCCENLDEMQNAWTESLREMGVKWLQYALIVRGHVVI